jgi:hypothetical protein
VGMIYTGLSLIGLILLAIVQRLVSADVEAWSPVVIDWLIKRAVSRLPQDDDLRVRLNEEWRSFINDTPGTIIKLLRAYGLSRGATRLARERSEYRTAAECMASRAFGVMCLGLLLPIFIGIAAALKIERPQRPLFYRARSGITFEQIQVVQAR